MDRMLGALLHFASISSAPSRALVLRQPDVAARLKQLGGIPVDMSPPQTAAFLEEEGESWPRVITAAGIKAL